MNGMVPGWMPAALMASTLLLLAGCSPAPADVAAPAAAEATGNKTAATDATTDGADMATTEPDAETTPTSVPVHERTGANEATPAPASISGAIRDGNRPPPALRVCATPVGGGAATCVDTAAGAREYRIEVAPGRYHLLGWVQSGELKLIAHATQIRCIRAPCPPDELIVVAVAAGEHREGIDLGAGYVDVPAGWPRTRG